ncbi:SRPBCC family protein [Siphonobacter aquaeclarae]|nr:SRPBCC domain-containing protein [Siphonobacter aquaeclarae]
MERKPGEGVEREAVFSPAIRMETSYSILIHARPESVWAALTEPAQMIRWMGDPEMRLEVETDWLPGSPVIVRGFHHVSFENRGTVLAAEKNRRLEYTHLSSVSRLRDIPENHTVFSFLLTPEKEHTLLALSLRNFPTESIRKHFEFYWPATLTILKEVAEENVNDSL